MVFKPYVLNGMASHTSDGFAFTCIVAVIFTFEIVKCVYMR